MKAQTITVDGAYGLGDVGALYQPNGVAMVAAFGTWGGGTLTLQVSLDGVNWLPVKDGSAAVTLTSNGYMQVLVKGLLRVVLSGSSGASLTLQSA